MVRKHVHKNSSVVTATMYRADIVSTWTLDDVGSGAQKTDPRQVRQTGVYHMT